MRTWSSVKARRCEQVLQPAGRGDEDVRAARVARLLLEADAAVDGADLEVAGCASGAQLVDDLAGELARRREHQRRRAAASAAIRSTIGDAEGERLAGARGRLGEHVAAGEHVGDDELLDGEGRVDAALLESARQPRADTPRSAKDCCDMKLLAAHGAANDSGGDC